MSEHNPHAAYQQPDDLDEYQQLAASTAVYPRVYTEDQVCAIIFEVFNQNGLDHYDPEDLSYFTREALDKFETEFSRLVYPVLGLVGEAGEIANKLKKVARDNEGRWEPDLTEDYEKEVGDVLWYVAAVATGLKSSLGTIGSKNIAKLFSRKARGVLGGSGDNR